MNEIDTFRGLSLLASLAIAALALGLSALF
jgi:hypothetical protein